MHRITFAAALPFALIACNSSGEAVAGNDAITDIAAVDGKPFRTQNIASFDEPWAMVFTSADTALVTEKPGNLLLVKMDGSKVEVGGVPEVEYGGQGGLGDVVLAPDFATSKMVYLSWVEKGDGGTRGAVVGRAMLDDSNTAAPKLTGMKIIWTQTPKVTGGGHFSHRMAFSPDGKYLFIGSGDRQKFTPAQDMQANLGKILRLNPDGSIPADNPFAAQGGIAAQVWTLGHRNILGIAFDANGQLWNQEMGPAGGDELNLVEPGKNYGYPIVSNGNHYDGRDIPDHNTRPEFAAPAVSWNPVISPGGLIFYSGSAFPQWKGNAFIGGLSSEALVRVSFDGASAKEAARYEMGARIREVEQAPDGALYILEDGEGGRLLKLVPTAR